MNQSGIDSNLITKGLFNTIFFYCWLEEDGVPLHALLATPLCSQSHGADEGGRGREVSAGSVSGLLVQVGEKGKLAGKEVVGSPGVFPNLILGVFFGAEIEEIHERAEVDGPVDIAVGGDGHRRTEKLPGPGPIGIPGGRVFFFAGESPVGGRLVDATAGLLVFGFVEGEDLLHEGRIAIDLIGGQHGKTLDRHGRLVRNVIGRDGLSVSHGKFVPGGDPVFDPLAEDEDGGR